eukprot:jgi/Chrzof1/9885/Cz04g19190.t1
MYQRFVYWLFVPQTPPAQSSLGHHTSLPQAVQSSFGYQLVTHTEWSGAHGWRSQGHSHQKQQQQQQQQQQPSSDDSKPKAAIKGPDRVPVPRTRHPGDTIHSIFPSNGSPYQNFQARIMYGTYKLVQKQPDGDKLTGFTRVLHRMTDDEVMGEIPTFRVNPLQPKCDTWCEFPVADRPNAIVQWINATKYDASLIQGAWILMLESDYVWMKPLKAPGSAYDASVQGLGFVYDYINPQYPTAKAVLHKMCRTCTGDKIPASGPAPVLLRPDELEVAALHWERYTAHIESDKHAKEVLGWVREMYAWCLAVQTANVSIIHQAPPNSLLLSQPPHDHVLGKAAMFHYTWGVIYKKGEKDIWKFDKRFYTAADDALKVPKLTLPPPFEDGWVLQDGTPISRNLNTAMHQMLSQMNLAIDRLPDLRPNNAEQQKQ